MIVRITGTLVEVTEESVVIERDGLAREVLVPPFALTELAAHRGREVTLHTHEYIEGNQAGSAMVPRMLGFLHLDDKLFYSRFVGVKGIGPRKALKALSQPVRIIATWIESGDVKSLGQLSGIGKRAAELIVASLKGKLQDLALAGGEGAAEASPQWTAAQQDALEILVGLGDGRSDAERWLARAAQLHPDFESPDDWVRAAYRIRAGVEA